VGDLRGRERVKQILYTLKLLELAKYYEHPFISPAVNLNELCKVITTTTQMLIFEIKIAFMRKLRAYLIQGMLVIAQFVIFCLPISYLKM
jgi:hypothetical protein